MSPTLFGRYCKGWLRMRNRKAAGAVFLHYEETGRHHSISQRHTRRHAQSATDADRLAMHEAEIGHHRACEREGRSLHEVALDDEHADRAEDEAGEDRAAAHDFQPVIEHAL